MRPSEACHFSGQAAPFRARSREAARKRPLAAPLARHRLGPRSGGGARDERRVGERVAGAER
ncbi:hypothetical protein ACT3XD_18280, partial [Halomonas sp. AOP7-B1-5]|uniref:hypothetical protein n=1 Tax=Halomonas sp. AOP7-B1-5 TaxID=3457642 RepID=UPI0040297F99